ncbi:hypothetical protein LX36DRAFT_279416 [Colletotrichum falcatum]|nr:hypothetical protein LX36DRAFT_279416 [Colletotrichum falcatum]
MDRGNRKRSGTCCDARQVRENICVIPWSHSSAAPNVDEMRQSSESTGQRGPRPDGCCAHAMHTPRTYGPPPPVLGRAYLDDTAERRKIRLLTEDLLQSLRHGDDAAAARNMRVDGLILLVSCWTRRGFASTAARGRGGRARQRDRAPRRRLLKSGSCD